MLSSVIALWLRSVMILLTKIASVVLLIIIIAVLFSEKKMFIFFLKRHWSRNIACGRVLP